MDSKDHPVVQQGIKAAEITSNVPSFTLLLTAYFTGCFSTDFYGGGSRNIGHFIFSHFFSEKFVK